MQSYKDRIAAYLKNEKAAVGMPISPKAFIILNLITLGAFTQVWAYHNFQKDQHYKKHPKLIAFVKCLFLPITLITLLNYLEEAAKQLGSALKIPKNLIAFCYLLSLAVNIYSVLMFNATQEIDEYKKYIEATVGSGEFERRAAQVQEWYKKSLSEGTKIIDLNGKVIKEKYAKVYFAALEKYLKDLTDTGEGAAGVMIGAAEEMTLS